MRCYDSVEMTPSRSVRKCSTGCFHVLNDTSRRDTDGVSYRSWKMIGHPLFYNADPLYKHEKDPMEISPVVAAPAEDTRLIRVGAGSASAADVIDEPLVCEASAQPGPQMRRRSYFHSQTVFIIYRSGR